MQYFSNLVQMLTRCFQIREPIILALQGASASGKTTLSKFLCEQLNQHKVGVEVVALDNYYRTYPYEQNKAHHYDFDNPAALDWNAIESTLSAYTLNKSTIPVCTYDFQNRISTLQYKDNSYPAILIVEGIYAHNLFLNQQFDLKKLRYLLIKNFKEGVSGKAARQSPKGNCEGSSKPGESKPNFFITKTPKLSAIKVLLKVDKELLKSQRAARDVATGNATCEESYKRFDEKIWPATEKWVYASEKEANFIIDSGSHNKIAIRELLSQLLKYKNITCPDNQIMFNGSQLIIERDATSAVSLPPRSYCN